jgi:hypothetical protein
MGIHKTLRQGNWNCKECLPDHAEHVELVCAVHAEKTATQPLYHSRKTKQLHSQETELASLLKSCIVQWLSIFWYVIFFCPGGTKVLWSHWLCFCTVNWAASKPLWQEHPEGQSGSGLGKIFVWLEGATYFQIKTYNKIAIQSVLTKIIHYDLGCFQVIMWVSSHTA